MYIQIIIIFILLAISMILHAVTLALLLKGKKNNKVTVKPSNNIPKSINFGAQNSSLPSIVTCKRCYTRFDSKHMVCPKCGTPIK